MNAPAPHAPTFTLTPARPHLASDNVHAIDAHKGPSARARHTKLVDRWHTTFVALRDRVRADAREHGDHELEELFEAYNDAAHSFRWYWERRATALARQVRDLLGCRETTEVRRANAVAALYGRADTLREANLLSDPERQLLEHYRTLSGADKAFIFTLAKRMTAVVAREEAASATR